MKNSKMQKLKKRGSTLLLLVLFMCVLATVVAVILVSSPAVDAQCGRCRTQNDGKDS